MFTVKMSKGKPEKANQKEQQDKGKKDNASPSTEAPKKENTKLSLEDVDLSKYDRIVNGDRSAFNVLFEDSEFLVVEENRVKVANEHFMVILKARHTSGL